MDIVTLRWVDWRSTSKLNGYLAGVLPGEFEETFYVEKRADQTLVRIQKSELPSDPGDSFRTIL